MVSGYDDVSAVKWAQENGIDIIRGEGRIVSPGTIEVAGETHTAGDIVIATGFRPGDSADRRAARAGGCLDEPRGDRRQARRASGQAAGARRRAGGRRDGAGAQAHGYLRRPGRGLGAPAFARAKAARRGARQGAGLGGHRAALRSARIQRTSRGRGLRARVPRRQGPEGRQAAGRDRPEAAPGGHRVGERRDRARRAWHPGRCANVRRRGDLGDRGRDRHLAADVCRQVSGPRRGGEHPRPQRRGELRRGAARGVHRPAGGCGRRGGGRGHGHRVTGLRAPHVDLLPGVRECRLPDARLRRPRGSRARTRSGPRRESGSGRRPSRSGRRCRSPS